MACSIDSRPILITGGAGFIGSHLADRLLADGVSVVLFDDLNDSYNPRIKRHNNAKALENPQCSLIEGDLRSRDDLQSVFDAHDFRVVVHLAARAGVRASIQGAGLYEQVNVGGTVNLLEACRDRRIEHVLAASSSSVYGNSARVPFREDDPADRPISPYAATKRALELICHTYYHLYGIPITCFRFFTVYGPRQRPDMAFHKFTRSILMDETIRLFGDGSTRRDYTFIDDIVDGLTAAIERPGGYEVVNLGNSETVELREAVNTLERILDRKAKIEWLPEQPGDVKNTYADISRARELYGYDPRVQIAEGIERFVSWFQQNRRFL